ncbi:MAG: type II toxin-antitoxin system PemK/MazF family toxin [Methylococcales bacterium]|nr:type II toxin-antitoxin system PemK/MazF family toxin [Methylococcales bacterium]MDD5754527.1 type II toxin-antitoxin system PemK/MazF family toxin [Methylococcales bacterium]
MDVKTADVVLCEFYFSDLKTTKNRPVLVLKDNLPHYDFVGLPISSQLDKLHDGEFEIDNSMFQIGGIPKKSKIIVRKPFVVSKNVVIKKYGSLNQHDFANYHQLFCQYFGCDCV